MKVKWNRSKISDLCQLIVDCVNKTAPSVSNITPYKMIRTSNIKNGRISLNDCKFVDKQTFEKWTRRAKVEIGDVLLTREAPMGEVGYVNYDEQTFLGQRIMQYRVNPELLDSKFLLYSFLSPDLQFQFGRYNNGGSIVSHICVPDCFEFKISTPPLIIQQKIASVLSSLDEKIELNNSINSELEQMARMLYNYWFVQFDFPNEEGKPYKSSGGKMVYNKLLKREIPEGWEVNELGKHIGYSRGISYTAKSINDHAGIPLINLKSFNLNGTYREDGLKFYNGNYNSDKLVKQNDLLIAITDVTREAEIIGKSIFVPELGEKILCSCDVAKVIPNEQKLNKGYLRFLFNSEYYHNYIRHFASGTLVLHLDLNGINWFKNAIPPIELQNKFGKLVENIECKVQSNNKQNQQLSKLRDWLLPMLMNGQVKVESNYGFTGENSVYKKEAQLNIPGHKMGFAKQVLAGKIVSEFRGEPYFTHIKFQKLQYLAEHVAGVDLNLNYYRQAAGPYDPQFMHTVADKLKASNWYEEKNHKFYPLSKVEQIEGYYQGYFGEVNEKLDSLFLSLKDCTQDLTEIIATIYAVWNDRIILKQSVSDEELIEEFYNWSERKKQYAREQVLEGLKWIKEKGFEPRGFGQVIKVAKKN